MSPAPLRVVHLINDLERAGAQLRLARLVRGARTHDPSSEHVVICLRGQTPLAHELRTQGVRVHCLGMGRFPTPKGLLGLVRLLRALAPPIVHTWLYQADLLGLLCARLARVPRLAWSVVCSDLQLEHYSWWSRRVFQLVVWLSPGVDVVVANASRGQAWHTSRGYRPGHWALIPNGFDLQVFKPDEQARIEVREELGLPPHARLVGMMARFDPLKDHDTFMSAARYVLQTRQDVHFVLAGQGVDLTQPRLQSHLAQTDLKHHIHLLGLRSDLPRLYAALDLATLSSRPGEGFPNALGEAMACGIPCVSTDSGDAADLVGSCGRIVAPETPAALAQAWLELLELPAEQGRALGQAARQRMEQHYTLESMLDRYSQLYHAMVEA